MIMDSHEADIVLSTALAEIDNVDDEIYEDVYLFVNNKAPEGFSEFLSQVKKIYQVDLSNDVYVEDLPCWEGFSYSSLLSVASDFPEYFNSFVEESNGELREVECKNIPKYNYYR